MKRIEQIMLLTPIAVIVGFGPADSVEQRPADASKATLVVTQHRPLLEPVAEEDCNSNGEPPPCDMDCNANSRPDDLDLYMGTSRDCDADRSPDECEAPTPGDLDGDGQVNMEDRATFVKCHRPLSPGVTKGCEASDLNGDGRVDCADWSILRCAWTEGDPPEYARCRTASEIAPIDE